MLGIKLEASKPLTILSSPIDLLGALLIAANAFNLVLKAKVGPVKTYNTSEALASSWRS